MLVVIGKSQPAENRNLSMLISNLKSAKKQKNYPLLVYPVIWGSRPCVAWTVRVG
jgi:hypothetical protein